jgi:hypothetical protein
MILFLDFVLILFAMVVLTGLVTQVVIPLVNGTPFFPFFRKSEVAEKIEEAAKELETVAELEQLSELEEEINRRKAQLKKET